ncbi:MAG: ABC transporter substrate-binding protein [Desulfovibrio sp.]|nr:ABC transporter substrate-binding protein [Desulfovibrio sp.]
MLKVLLFLLALHLLPPAGISHAASQDAPGPARRVVSLYPAFSEILDAMDLSGSIVGKTKNDRLKGLERVPVVGTHMRPNTELIASLSPDLVLLLAGRTEVKGLENELNSLGIETLTLPLDSFEDLWLVTRTLGKRLNKQKKAEECVTSWQTRLRAIRDAPKKNRPGVFFEVRSPSLLAAGSSNIVREIIEYAGGVNVVRTDKKLVHLSDEAVLALDPDVYIIQKGPMNPDPVPLWDRPTLKALRAAGTQQVLVVEEERFSRPGPQSIEACSELAAWLQNCK